MSALSELVTVQPAPKAISLPGESWLYRIALTTIVALAGALRLANLSAVGYANHYYTAAITAMLQSWHNFFFAAAEPGGSVSVDKPPVGFWLQVISARFLGINGFSVLLPEIIAGLLSVVLIAYLVRRKFGPMAGLIAGLALAITPVVVATDRNNTIDSTLILTLLLAAWAFIKATETARPRYLLLGALLVGIGFNIKMLQAYLPLPAFYALYFLGTSESLWKKIGKLSLATVLLLVVSLSWATIVDLTPADQRPYVGSSSDNSEWSLIIGYNGVERLLGMGGRGGLLSNLLMGNTGGGFRGGGPTQPQGSLFQPPTAFRPGGFGGGMFNTGYPGLYRLFVAPLSSQMSWLLPIGFASILLLTVRSRLRWPLAPKHQAIVVWGGWLLTGLVFFSIAGFFHEYYLSMLAPALSALVGTGVVELWLLNKEHNWIATALLLIITAVTLWFQYYTASSFVSSAWWFPLLVALYIAGLVILVIALVSRESVASFAGFACMIAILMVTPGIWSALTALNTSTNQTLPAAFNGGVPSFGPVGRGGPNTTLTGLQINQPLLSYLVENTQDVKYLMAVPSSMQGADYVIATGRPVLYLGGFGGQDKVETAESLAQLVAKGELRYMYWNAAGGGFGGRALTQFEISNWITASCKQVHGYDATTDNTGAPDGIAPNQDGGSRGFGSLPVSLYRCGG